MRTRRINLHHHLLVLAASVTLVGCGAFGDDSDRYEKLDRLRVLGIRSEPADLVVGETATLSADIYEPGGRELSYEWSWCPSRGDGEADFACNVSEQDLDRAWTEAGLDGSPPSYDLGTDSEAELPHVLTPSFVAALCKVPSNERVAAACFAGLEGSVKLTVKTSEAEPTAFKSIPLLLEESPDAERNENPASDFAVTVLDYDSDAVVKDDEPLRAGRRYTLVAEVDEATAEVFTPKADPGGAALERRRETLVMSWFITAGELVAPEGDGDGIGDDRSRTTFVDGSNNVADLAKNGWRLPLTAGSSADLHMVLRDERGGVGWSVRSFSVVGGDK